MPESAPVADYMNLATRTIPRDGFLLADLVRGAVSRLLPGSNMADFQMTCEVDGRDLPRVALDLSGWHVPVLGNAPDDRHGDPAPVATEEGMIEHLTLRAVPLIVEDLPIYLAVELRRVGIAWHTLANGDIALGAADSDDSQTSGRFVLEAEPQQVAELIAGVINAAEEAEGIVVSRPRASVEQISDTQFSVSASCRVRYKLFRFRAGIALSGRLAPTGTFTVEAVSFTGSNPLLRLLARPARAELLGPIDLNEMLPEGSMFSGLRFTAGQSVRVEGRVVTHVR